MFQVTWQNDAEIGSLSRDRLMKAINERSELLGRIFEEAGDDLDHSRVTVIDVKDGHDLATYIRNMNDELALLGKRASEFDELDKARSSAEQWQQYAKSHAIDPSPFAPRGGDAPRKQLMTIGQAFVKSQAYAAAKGHVVGTFEADVDPIALFEAKATMSTGAGWAPETTRTGRLVLDEQRPIEVMSYLPLYPTSQSAIVYMEETTFTNNAAERAEEGAYAESALALTEKSVAVRSIGTSLPVTDEQLADVEGVAAYIDGRLTFMVQQRLDSQILSGNGVAPNLLGTLNVSGVQTQAKGGDSTPDAIYKAIVKVQTGGRAQPNVVFMHPNDWQDVRLLKTSDGVYIWGSPSDPGPERIWGLPVAATTAVTENTAIVGDYARHSGLHMRQGVELRTGYVNDDFLDGRVTIRAGVRAAVVHYRPTAFCTVTGI